MQVSHCVLRIACSAVKCLPQLTRDLSGDCPFSCLNVYSEVRAAKIAECAGEPSIFGWDQFKRTCTMRVATRATKVHWLCTEHL